MIPGGNMNLKYLTLIILVLLSSCGKEDKENLDNATSDEGGRCKISINNNVHLCVEYPDSTLATDASTNCTDNVFAGNYDGLGTSRGVVYESGKNSDCSTGNLFGTCTNTTLSTGTAFYYSDAGQWNATTAETDCTSTFGGSWSAN